MEILSRIFDNRIYSWNLYVETTYGEYLGFAREIIANNDFQRKRVRTSKTIYSLLKNDLVKGCVMPPLVLASVETGVFTPESVSGQFLLEYIGHNVKMIQILDGLQRTYTLIDAEEEVKGLGDEQYERFSVHKLRLEIYVEINKFGILYRMLTLNTGQTPMSARHQIEILYSDLLDTGIDGITLVTDIDGHADPNDNQFVFKNVIDGFNSYMNRTELPIDRQEILDNVRMLENMAGENIAGDIFNNFLSGYLKIFAALRNASNNYFVSDDDLKEYGISDSPFGRKICKIFSTSQALTGYGAALGKLKDNHLINSFSEIEAVLPELIEINSESTWIFEMLLKLDAIKRSSKKIGNAQRMFFMYFFRELLNKETESFINIHKAVENGYQKYDSQVN